MTPQRTSRTDRRRLVAALWCGAVVASSIGCGVAPADAPTGAVWWSAPSPSTVPTSAVPPSTVSPSGASAPTPGPTASVAVPAGMTAGIVVLDRLTGEYVVRQNASMRFRSASVVKLLIVLDHLWDLDPGHAVPAADRARLDVMLRSSEDSVATSLWKRHGGRAVVSRMVTRLGLVDTTPPPIAQPGFWGYTAISAADVVRVYRYLLEMAPAPVRDYVLGNLRQSTKCGTDRYDQSFGIPGAFGRPWAVKQGWSGFGDRPVTGCVADAAMTTATNAPRDAVLATPGPDMAGEVLHTTGTVGTDDRAIVVILSVHRDGTPFDRAAAALTQLARTVPVPGALPR